MDCNGECSSCFAIGNCEWFFNNFILPNIIEEQRETEYLEEQIK